MEGDSIMHKLEHVSGIMNNDIWEEFLRIKTYEQRFKLVLKTLLQRFASSYNFKNKEKLTEHSIKLREDGNRSFVSGQYHKALKEYTESIMNALNLSEELALAYANRSAALYELEKFEDCLADIDRVLMLKYPDRLKMKLYKRKAMCLLVLERSGADSALQDALTWLDKTSLNKQDKEKCEFGLRLTMAAAKTMPVTNSLKKPVESPKILKPNPKIPSVSDAVTIKYSKKYGRHLVATRKIRPGETLILEKAFCKRLYPQFIHTNCSYCLLASYAMIPCNYCVHAAYCSETCRDKAWEKYHEIECSVTGPLLYFEIDDLVFLGLRMAIVATDKGKQLDALRKEVISIDGNPDPIAQLYSNDGKIHSDHYRSIHCSHSNKDNSTSTSKLIDNAVRVAICVTTLAKESEMFGKKLDFDTLAENPDVIFVGGLICKYLHLGHRIKTHKIATEDGNSSLTVYGNALEALSSLLNHSCDANTARHHRSDLTSHHFSLYPIEKGEQIFDNYGPEFAEMEKGMRMVQCMIWKFYCDCIACTENWPLMDKIPSYKNQSLSRQNEKKLDAVMQNFRKCNRLIQRKIEKNEPNTVDELVKMIEMLFNLAKRPCKELILAVTMLKYSQALGEGMLEYDDPDDDETEINANEHFLTLKASMLQ